MNSKNVEVVLVVLLVLVDLEDVEELEDDDLHQIVVLVQVVELVPNSVLVLVVETVVATLVSLQVALATPPLLWILHLEQCSYHLCMALLVPLNLHVLKQVRLLTLI